MIFSIIISLIIAVSPQSDKKEKACELAGQGMQLIEEAKYTEALELFSDAIKLDKNCKEAHLGKGIAYYRSGDYNPREIFPEEIIKRALKIDPDYVDAKVHLGWCYYYKNPDDIETWGGYFNTLIEEEAVSGELIFKIATFFNSLENKYYYDFKRKVFPFLKYAYELGFKDTEACYMLGWEYFVRDSIDTAVKLYKEGMSLDKSKKIYRPYIDLGIIYFNINSTSPASEYFKKANENMPETYREYFKDIPESNKLRSCVLAGLAIKFFLNNKNKLTDEGKDFIENGTIYYGKYPPEEQAFLCLLSENEKNSYLTMDKISERKKYRKQYFRIRDLNQFDKNNIPEDEFERRFYFCSQTYNAGNSRGFDDRGKIYLKYGEPENRHFDNLPLGEKNVNFEMETWIYSKINSYMVFDFANMGYKDGFRLAPNILEALPVTTSSLKRVLVIWKLCKNRAYLSSMYNGMYNKITEYLMSFTFRSGRRILDEMQMEKILYGTGEVFVLEKVINSAQGEDIPLITLDQILPDIMMDMTENEIYREELTEKMPSYFPVETEKEPLVYGYKISGFRDKETTRNEIYYGIKLDNLEYKIDEEKNMYFSNVKFYTSFIDSNFNTVFKDSVLHIFESDTTFKSGLAVNQIDKTLEPGEYTVFVQMSNPEGNRIGVYTDKIYVDNYSVDSLKTSDLQYAFEIKEASFGDKYNKNGLNILPHPFFEVERNRPLFLYYEIYNLSLGENNQTSYKITYDIKLIERKESIFKKFKDIFTKDDKLKESISMIRTDTGSKSNIFEYTSFDLTSMRIGKYELNIIIHDLVSGKVSEKSDTFILVK